MFTLVELNDTVQIPSNMFNIPIDQAIAEQLNRRIANRVIIDVGLGICLFDILSIQESFIYHGDSETHTKVHFRFLIFRPFIGEVLTGKLRSCSLEGLHISLGFFDDILVPSHWFPEPCRFDEREQVWIWEYQSDGEKSNLFMDVGETVRFKVKEEVFTDTSPGGPTSTSLDTHAQSTSEGLPVDNQRRTPYLIKGSIEESGLGLVSWWK
ncbi:RNA polymerase III subunit H [Brevipalpus obovatus]|uniref:RNA polymerase III subunit H n=1 Tax=Brevipalpus obovatus TaxID=246614 RepID=UPI003D9F786F